MKSIEKNIAQESSVGPKQRVQRPWHRRWPLIGLMLAVVIVAVVGEYWLSTSRVQPLVLPKIPAQLSLTQLGLTNAASYQRPLLVNPLNDPTLPATPKVDDTMAPLEHAAGMALLKQKHLDQALGYLRAAVQSDGENLLYANDFRLALRDNKRYNDEENFFSDQLKISDTATANINLALTYVDQMRTCPLPPDGLVCQAQYSSRSISILDQVLARDPYNIIARYARGLNHLYWPKLMGHLPKAQDDLSYAVALAHPLRSLSKGFAADAYTALGDVFAKDGQVDTAHNVWLNGLQYVPNSGLLESRLAIPREKLADDESGSLRGLGVYVDTNIALFWAKEG